MFAHRATMAHAVFGSSVPDDADGPRKGIPKIRHPGKDMPAREGGDDRADNDYPRDRGSGYP